jgi:hypothetical protein
MNDLKSTVPCIQFYNVGITKANAPDNPSSQNYERSPHEAPESP